MASLKVCHTVFHEMPSLSSWEELLDRFPGIAHLLRAQQALGLRLSWLAPSSENRTFFRDGVKFRFIQKSGFFSSNPAPGRDGGWQQARRLARAIADENPEVIHHHGLNSWVALQALQELVRTRAVRCLVQDHGGGVPVLGIKRRLYRKALTAMRYAVFGNSQTRDLWIRGKMLAPEQCRILFAASSVFTPAGAEECARLRRELQMEGAPVLGWVAHLNRNKDPATILYACAKYFEKNPAARLYMHFIEEDLRAVCEDLIAAHPALRSRVFLRGRLPHAQLESFYRALDYFVQGSHHETYGYTAVEAMSTGAIPILTDIPSFRLLCASGHGGYLFPPGEAGALLDILLKLPPTAAWEARARVLRRFAEEFSYPAIAQKFLTLYQDQ